ncbi:MAG: hypothetical protein JST54_20875 [Deltaproteobacteria bacterium]|nr:hypothetical protein [Deltaproteobacteria bacterium]
MSEPIDLDAETIQVDGRWMKKDELAAAIKQKLDRGDFTVAGLSASLERLHQALGKARAFTFKLDGDAADALTAYALKKNTTVGAILRQAVMGALNTPPFQATTEPASPEEHATAVALRPKTGGNPRTADEVERAFFTKGS